MERYLLLTIFLLVFALLTSCKDKVICPAFQSTYILEEEASNQLFSLFGEDSLPKYKVAINKDRYGMVTKVKYKKRLNELRTIHMQTIYPPEEIDSLNTFDDAFVIVDNDTIEYEASNSSNVRFNSDQRSYMRYIGDDIAKAYERKMAEYKKIQKEIEDKRALEPLKPDRKTRKEEKRKKKESKKDAITETEEEVDEWEIY